MPEPVAQALVIVAKVLEIVGAGALVLGFVVISLIAAWQTVTKGAGQAYARYRKALGRVVLIGLEILVAATIIKTITIEPTPENLGLLGCLVAIRTLLGWTTTLEMYGRWPWQRRVAGQP